MNDAISYYDRNAEEFCRTTRDSDMSVCRGRFLKLLEKNTCRDERGAVDRSNVHILDAGCGSGRDARAFLEAGYRVTAIDGSANICKEAEKFLKRKVYCISFGELDCWQEFDGIWACASLLHIPYDEINQVLKHMWNGLKEGGLLYASFKYGEGMRIRGDRCFYDYSEAGIHSVMVKAYFCIEDIFVTQDVRRNRLSEQWINVLARRNKSKIPVDSALRSDVILFTDSNLSSVKE